MPGGEGQSQAVSLREYIERILHEQDRALQALAITSEREVKVLADATAREVRALGTDLATMIDNTDKLARGTARVLRTLAALKRNLGR